MNLEIYEAATDWIVKHRDGGLDAREKIAFDTWLRESPQHVRAYLEMSSVWEGVPSLDPGWNASAEELIARAREDQNVVPLSQPTRAGRKERNLEALPQGHEAAVDIPTRLEREAQHTKTKPLRRRLVAIAASLLVAFVGSWFYLQREVYSTDTGEQRSLALTDGSTVELNSRSKIRVHYTEQERRVDLLEGQALFRVVKNKARPFIVQTRKTQIRAVGTAFDVYRTEQGAIVTVVEGRVSVQSMQRPEQGAAATQILERITERHAPASQDTRSVLNGTAAVLLDAGQQLRVTPTAIPVPQPADVAVATAWTRRSLVFESSPLTEVAHEFNRYNTRRLVIEDPRLEAFHVSGVFSSVEPTLLLRFLRAQPELDIRETDEEIRIDRR